MSSLRWENLVPPICDEECSDIDDSCSDENFEKDQNECKSDENLQRRRIPEKREFRDLYWDEDRPYQHEIFHNCILNFLSGTGYYLAILPTNEVVGIAKQDKAKFDVRLSVTSIQYGILQLQGYTNDNYIAMNSSGHLYAEADGQKDNTKWERWDDREFEAFRCLKYADKNWFLGIKGNGRLKCGKKTSWGSKSIQFSCKLLKRPEYHKETDDS